MISVLLDDSINNNIQNYRLNFNTCQNIIRKINQG